MPLHTTEVRYFFDEVDPKNLYTLADLQRQHQALLDLIPTDGRDFEEFLFDAFSSHGGTVREMFTGRKREQW